MKISVEMILAAEGNKVKCFANVYKSHKDNAAVTAHKAVRNKIREYGRNVEIIEVKLAGEDVTTKVLEIDLDYHRNKIADWTPAFLFRRAFFTHYLSSIILWICPTERMFIHSTTPWLPWFFITNILPTYIGLIF